MTEKEKWEIAISAISTAITLITLLYSIYLGRKANSRKVNVFTKFFDKDNKECKNPKDCATIYIRLSNIGNRNIKMNNVSFEINSKNKAFLKSVIHHDNYELNIDASRRFEISCKDIKKILKDFTDEIKPRKKLIIYFYDTANKKYKLKFNIKLVDILNQSDEVKKTMHTTINISEKK